MPGLHQQFSRFRFVGLLVPLNIGKVLKSQLTETTIYRSLISSGTPPRVP